MKPSILLLVSLLTISVHARLTDVYTNEVFGVQVISEYCAHDNLDYGIPSTNVDEIIDRDGYAIGFSNTHHQPIWASYRLTSSELQSTIRRTNDFRPDRLLMATATPQDYKSSGYDKGHLVPAADLGYSTWTMHNSFLMSNMSPQAGVLNRESWRLLEEWVRATALREKSLLVVTGPIFFRTNAVYKTIGASKVTVPDAYYKVVLDETPPCKIIAFILMNDKSSNDVKDHVADVRALERQMSFTFFERFPHVEDLKKQQDVSAWMW